MLLDREDRPPTPADHDTANLMSEQALQDFCSRNPERAELGFAKNPHVSRVIGLGTQQQHGSAYSRFLIKRRHRRIWGRWSGQRSEVNHLSKIGSPLWCARNDRLIGTIHAPTHRCWEGAGDGVLNRRVEPTGKSRQLGKKAFGYRHRLQEGTDAVGDVGGPKSDRPGESIQDL